MNIGFFGSHRGISTRQLEGLRSAVCRLWREAGSVWGVCRPEDHAFEEICRDQLMPVHAVERLGRGGVGRLYLTETREIVRRSDVVVLCPWKEMVDAETSGVRVAAMMVGRARALGRDVEVVVVAGNGHEWAWKDCG